MSEVLNDELLEKCLLWQYRRKIWKYHKIFPLIHKAFNCWFWSLEEILLKSNGWKYNCIPSLQFTKYTSENQC